MNSNKMTTNVNDDDIESSPALVEEVRIHVGPTIASATTNMAVDVAPQTSTLHTMEVVTDSANQGTVFVSSSSSSSPVHDDHEVGSGCCPCTGCTSSWTSDTASSVMNLCPLVRDGCRACSAVYQEYSARHRGRGSVNPTAQHRRPCLFHTCSIRNSRIVKDEIVLELDRILSAAAANQKQVSVAREPWNDRVPSPPDVLPVGTIVLCCWYLNGRRHWASVTKSQPKIRRHWHQSAESILHSIRFCDGRVRHNVPRTELLSSSNWECDVWNEQARLLHGEQVSSSMRQGYFEHCSLVMNNDISDRSSQNKKTKKRTLPDMNETPTDTKKEYYEQRKSKRLSQRLSFQELFYQRCRTCYLCRLPDCGECESCRTNRTTTSIHRQVCIVNMCMKIPVGAKQQKALYGWEYFFEPPFAQRTASINKLHPFYQRLRLIAPSSLSLLQTNDDPKIKSQSIFTALHAVPSVDQRVELGAFFESLTGHPLQEPCKHPLISNGYVHEYSTLKGTVVLSGTISKCWKHFIHRALSFVVKFDKLLSYNDNMASTEASNLFLIEEVVSEPMAWGGYRKFCLRQRSLSKSPFVIPYYVNWIIPTKRYMVDSCRRRLPCLMLEFRDCLLQFEAKPSTIKGAGIGLFVKAVNGQGLTLQPGQMLDLGIYAPLRSEDIKSKHISMMKNLIYDWTIETWSFATKTKDIEACVYDPTDDFTGTRHCAAERNMISYVNETCRSDEVANVSAQHDPEGNVHYLLGHWEESEGLFTISSDGSPLELMIDYGPAYERCRLRNGYSRVSDIEINKSVIKSEDDATSIVDIASFSYNQVKDCLVFLEDLYSKPSCNFVDRNHLLALVAAFALEDRLNNIVVEFTGFDFTNDELCDEGVSNMITTDAKRRLNSVIMTILMMINGVILKSAILSMNLLNRAVSKRIDIDNIDAYSPRNGAKDLLLDLYQ